MRCCAAVLACLLLAAGQAMATSLPFSDDFNDGNDDGWTRADAAPFFSVVNGEYVINNYGGGDTYTSREDVVLPTNWVLSTDVKITSGVGGLSVVESATNPWANEVRALVIKHATLDLVQLMIHWGTGANASDWMSYTPGDTVYLTFEREESASVVKASVTGAGGTLNVTSPDLSSKLAACTLPGLGVCAGGYDAFDNVLFTAAVPEPGSLAVLASGLGACLFGAFRRRRK